MGKTVTTMGLEKKEKHELKKHAATIHCSNALSLLQRKISNALIYHAYHELLVNEEHKITIKQLCNLISYSGNNHAAIKEALRGLLSTILEWNVVSDTTGIEDWTASSIIASVSLQGPVCYYSYSPRMKQLLYSPSMFGKINLYIQSRFKSSYGLALYENCIRYRGLPYTKWFEMDIFRKLMGVPEDNYPIFRDFKRRVLDKSIEEVNTYSDLLVEPELARERRRVVKIRFILKERIKKMRLGSTASSNEELEANSILRSKLVNQFSLSPLQIEHIFRDYQSEFILEKLTMIENSKNYQHGKVKNLAAYLLSALKNDFQSAKSSLDVMKQNKRESSRTFCHLKELRRIAENIEKMYLTYREEMIDKAIYALSVEAKENFMAEFHHYAALSIKTILKLQRKKYNETNIHHSPQIKGLLRQFALQTLTSLRESLMPIERFIERFSDEERMAWHQYKLMESVSL